MNLNIFLYLVILKSLQSPTLNTLINKDDLEGFEKIFINSVIGMECCYKILQ